MNQAAEKSNRTQRITQDDQTALERYFGPLQAEFRRSTFGAMIDRLDADKHFSTPCKRCDGVGFSPEDVLRTTRELKRLEPERKEALARAGAYFVDGKKVDEHADPWDSYQRKTRDLVPRCGSCEGAGVVKVRGRVIGRHWSRYNLSRFERDTSGAWRPVMLDARPNSKPSGGPPPEPPHQVLVEFALMSRILDQVAEIERPVVQHLETYFGDEGAVWGRTRHTRIFSLYRYTRAARQLLAKGSQENPTDLGVSARLAVQSELDRQQPKVWRRQLLNAADEQARRIHDRMAAVWNTAKLGGDWRTRYRRLLERIDVRRRTELDRLLGLAEREVPDPGPTTPERAA